MVSMRKGLEIELKPGIQLSKVKIKRGDILVLRRSGAIRRELVFGRRRNIITLSRDYDHGEELIKKMEKQEYSEEEGIFTREIGEIYRKGTKEFDKYNQVLHIRKI